MEIGSAIFSAAASSAFTPQAALKRYLCHVDLHFSFTAESDLLLKFSGYSIVTPKRYERAKNNELSL